MSLSSGSWGWEIIAPGDRGNRTLGNWLRYTAKEKNKKLGEKKEIDSQSSGIKVQVAHKDRRQKDNWNRERGGKKGLQRKE